MQIEEETQLASREDPVVVALRFGVATLCNLVLLYLLPTLALYSGEVQQARSQFIAASVAVVPLVTMFPIFGLPDFGYKLAAGYLWLFPLFVFTGCFWELLAPYLR